MAIFFQISSKIKVHEKELKSYRDRQEILGGQVLLFRRTSQGTKYQSDNWYAKFTIPQHEPIQRSLKTKNKYEAEKQAEELLYEYKSKVKHGLSLKATKFSTVANSFVEDFASKTNRQSVLRNNKKDKHNAEMHRNISYITEKYLIPYFGDKTIQDIVDDDIEQYEQWRKEYWTNGLGAHSETVTYTRNGKTITRPKNAAEKREPSYSTINKELTVLRKIFSFAKQKKLIRAGEIPEIKNLKKPDNHSGKKSGLTPPEFNRLIGTLRIRHEAEKNPKHKKSIFLLMHYIMVMAHTGIRVAEAKSLRMSDCELIKKENKEYLKIFVSGKGKSRELIALDPATLILENIEDFHIKNAKLNNWIYKRDMPVFSNQYGVSINSFANSLDRAFNDANLLYDSERLKRSAGTFRKYYITAALMADVPPFTIAKQCGTSVSVIEKFYDELEIKHQPEKVTFQHLFSE